MNPLGRLNKESVTKTLANENELAKKRIKKALLGQINLVNQPSEYQLLADIEQKTEFDEIRTLYIINNAVPSNLGKAAKQYSSNESEPNEDVELLLKGLMNRKEIEETKMFREGDNEYESLGNLRIKRMRDSIESPVFGSKFDSYQSQRNMVRGFTMTSKDELDNAVSKKPVNQMFK